MALRKNTRSQDFYNQRKDSCVFQDFIKYFVFKDKLEYITLLSRQLEYQNRLILLKRSVDIFRQYKQLFDNKRLQLVSIIENNLIDKLNTIYKRVVSKRSIYIIKRFFLLAIFAVEYIELVY